jgi:hypothetical protein
MGRPCGNGTAAKMGENKVVAGHRKKQRDKWATEGSMGRHFKSATGQWSRTAIKPVRIMYTHTTIENTHK